MEKRLLGKMFEKVAQDPFDVIYWDGSKVEYGEGNPKFKLILNKPLMADVILKDASLVLGEAYMNGDVDFEGDITDILDLGYRNLDTFSTPPKIISKLIKAKNTPLKKQKEDIHYHYDIGNDFYALWLDESMSYSCGYFKNQDDTLNQAQINKTEYILEKLNLQPGETLLDIGSGWGELIIRAAHRYGVKSLGITLSEEQYNATKARISKEGLQGQVDVELLDYRELVASGRRFDKIVSVGMVEHVGKANIPLYLESVSKLLNEQGLVLLQVITKQIETETTNSWIDKYIFPGGYIPAIRELIYPMADNDLHLQDLESLRLHYARTLEHWIVNFDNNIDKIKTMFDNRFIRMWQIYLNACIASFNYSVVDLHQILLVKGVNNSLPMTRDYIYK